MAFGDYLPRRWRDRLNSEGQGIPMRRFFDDVVSDLWDNFPSMRMESFNPRINVSDTDNEIRVVAELPGIDEKDVEVSLTRNGVLVRGEKREEKRDGERNQYYECTYGSFERFIPLRTEVKEDEVKAHFEKGVLTVTIPKTEEARSRTKKIPIRSGNGTREGSSEHKESPISPQRPATAASSGHHNGAHR